MLILIYCVFVVHSLAYGLRLIKDYLTLQTNPNFLITIYVYPQTITITIQNIGILTDINMSELNTPKFSFLLL